MGTPTVDHIRELLQLADGHPGNRRSPVTPCVVCGTEVRVNPKATVWRDYCGPCEWAAEAERDRMRRRERRRLARGRVYCSTCERVFTPSRSDTRYCSPACRQKAYRQRKAATS